MRVDSCFAITAVSIAACLTAFQLRAEDLTQRVKHAVEKSTLDQPGTHPFHLKATYAPSFERDKGSNRVGEVEIWWQSPTHWRRELRSPEFHQIAIVDGSRQWQKNDGDYFPNWLRELAQAIVLPIPLPTDVILERVKSAEIRQIAGQTNINWEAVSGAQYDSWNESAKGKGYLAMVDKTGLLFYTGGPGFNGLYHDFKDFHGRMIAYTVGSGRLEVTAKVSILEDLGTTPADFFDANAPGGDPSPIETVVLDGAQLRKSLLLGKPFSWPPLTNGPLEGNTGTEIVLDRAGKIRELEPPISDNSGVNEAAEQGFRTMQFQPVLLNGVPVQAVGYLVEHFKTVRPAGVETFDNARTYFERGRKASCLGSGSNAPYMLHAEFQAGTKNGVQIGRYEDTWISDSEWKREAWFGSSHLIRSQIGEKHYLVSEGPDVGLLRVVMMAVEPIPAGDTMTESDWRIRRDAVNGTKSIRVFRGPEGPNGELEPGKSQGYWFSETGQLLKSYNMGFEIQPHTVESYNGVPVPRQIDVIKDGKVGLRLVVKEIGPLDPQSNKGFVLKGHEWQRAFTAEVR